jgi:NAD(P)-dependent dehydrogenase (short-subunit alcohol dehydrogenase family)
MRLVQVCNSPAAEPEPAMPQPAPSSRPVLITGCSSGIGHATAIRLAAAGFPVYASARRLEAIADLEDHGCRLLRLDVTEEATMHAAVEAVEAEHGALGVLVNNAGYSQSGAVESIAIEDVRRQFETNVFGLMRLTQLALPAMRAQRSGTIVNVSSMGANFTFPGGGVYHATKYALEAISDALRFEVKGFGVDVVVIQPGLIRTSFGDAAVSALEATDAQEGAYDAFNARVAQATAEVYEKGPLARLGGDPDDVAKAIEKAISASRPRIRYRVTPSAHLLVGQRALMTDGMWDAFLRTQFPQPGKGG